MSCSDPLMIQNHRPTVMPSSSAFSPHVDRDNPGIMDYIQLKHSVTELEKHASDWKRKIDLLQMEKQRTRQVLKSVASMKTTSSMSPMASRVSIGGRAMSSKTRA